MANYDSNNDMKDTEGEDWLDLSILDAKPTLVDLGNMDSGIIFDHGNRASMGLMMTNIYTNNTISVGTNHKTIIRS